MTATLLSRARSPLPTICVHGSTVHTASQAKPPSAIGNWPSSRSFRTLALLHFRNCGAHTLHWHATLLKSGGKDGAPMSAQTGRHAHRVLHGALARAVKSELLPRNVVSIIEPPKVEEREIDSLRLAKFETVLKALDSHPLHTIAATALATGARRGE